MDFRTGHARSERGSSLIGILLVLVIAGFIAWYAMTTYLATADNEELGGGAPLDQTRQQTTMADMRAIGRALQLMQADSGSLPADLAELEAGGYLVKVPAGDGWGNAWVYGPGAGRYTLTSLGSDGRHGPDAPRDWTTGAYEADLVMMNGQFIQAPAGR